MAAQLAEGRGEKLITKALAAEALQRRVLLYDKSGEEHYDLISALHKSVRNSDPDAALYWLARMLAGGRRSAVSGAARGADGGGGYWAGGSGGAESLSVARRMRCIFWASPEGDLALAQAVVYLCAGSEVECGLYGVWRGAGGD